MPVYQLRFYSASDRMPVVDFLDSPEVSREHKAKAWRLMQHLQSAGPAGNKYVEKLRGDVWELRVDYSGVAIRILFCIGTDATLYALHAIKKKRNKVPENEIKVAQERANRILKGEG